MIQISFKPPWQTKAALVVNVVSAQLYQTSIAHGLSTIWLCNISHGSFLFQVTRRVGSKWNNILQDIACHVGGNIYRAVGPEARNEKTTIVL